MLFIVLPLTKTLYMTPKIFLFAYQLPLSKSEWVSLSACYQKFYFENAHIQNPGIFRTLACCEPWHIQNPVIFITWHSGLRCCNQNLKVTISNPTRCSACFRDPTLLQSSWWPLGQICKKHSDWHQVSEAASSIMAQSWLWGSQILDRKKKSETWCIQDLKNIHNPVKHM